MSVRYAVPMILLVKANTVEEALVQAEITMNTANPRTAPGNMLFLDEELPTFAYDPELHDVKSAMDYDECALPYLSEPKKE